MQRLIVFALTIASTYASYVHKAVHRSIRLEGALAYYEVSIELEDFGSELYQFLLPKPQIVGLGSFLAKDGDKELLQVACQNNQIQHDLAQRCLKVTGKNFRVSYTITNMLEPYPKRIKQLETPYYLFSGESSHFLTPYETITQDLKLTFPSTKFSVPEGALGKANGKFLHFGPYLESKGVQFEPIKVHFEYDEQLPVFRNMDREVEVSMWGSTSFEEHYELLNAGPNLKGEFSRLDYQKHQKGKAGYWIAELISTLPRESKDIYYRDIIGNISTSSVTETKTAVKLAIKPRFPVFGGWITKWHMGYIVPTPHILSQDVSRFALSDTIENSFKGSVSETVVAKYIFPENAHEFNVTTGNVNPENMEFRKRFTYLDSNTEGRTLIELVFKNVPANTKIPVTISFTYKASAIIREPLMLVAGYFALFFSYMVFSRVSFSLKK